MYVYDFQQMQYFPNDYDLPVPRWRISTEELASHSHIAVSSANNLFGQARLSCDFQNTCNGVFYCDQSLGNNGRGSTGGGNTTLNFSSTFSSSITVQNTGGNQAHENRQPYIVVYRFYRTN